MYTWVYILCLFPLCFPRSFIKKLIVSLFTAQAIPGGKVVIDVSYFGVHVHQEDHDLCEELSCPVAEGDFVLSHTQNLPGFTPPVSFISIT